MAIKRYAPAVEVIERDESEFVQNPRQLYAGFVGYFNQGPVNTPVLVDNEQSLVQTFGKPDNKNYEFWFTASSYLAYSGSLYVVRVKPSGAQNATSGFRPLGYAAGDTYTAGYNDAIFNYDDFSLVDDFDAIHGAFASRETGKRGDSLAVYVCQGKDAWELDLKIQFGNNPLYPTNRYELSSSRITNENALVLYVNTGNETENALKELKKGHYIETGNTILEVEDITANTIKFKYISGDSVSIDVTENAVFEFKRIWRMRNYFSGPPTTSLFAQGLTGGREDVYDEIHVAVVDEDGDYTDVPGTVLERFDGLSVAKNAQNNAGESIFWESYINENSQYIYVINGPRTDDISGSAYVKEDDDGKNIGYTAGYTAGGLVPGWDYAAETIGESKTESFRNAGTGNATYKYTLKGLWDAVGEESLSTGFEFQLTNDKEFVVGATTTVAEYNKFVVGKNAKKIKDKAAVDISVESANVLVTASGGNTPSNLSKAIGSLVDGDGVFNGSVKIIGATTTTTDPLYGTYTNDYNGVYTSSNSLLLRNNKGKIATLKFEDEDDNILDLDITNPNHLQTSDLDVATPNASLNIIISAGRSEGIDWQFEGDGTDWGNSKTGESVGHITTNTTFKSLEYPTAFHLLGGDDGTIGGLPTNATDAERKINLRTGPNVEDSFDVLKNKRELDINLIISGPLNSGKQASLIDVAENRLDSVVFLSPERVINSGDLISKTENEKLNHILDWKDNNLKSSSYTFLDNNWKQVYDRYNSRTRWVPCNGDTAGIVSSLTEPWLSPAGLTNGFIRNALSIAYNPSDAHQDRLYQSSVNSIIRKQGQGLVLWGDRTGQEKASAFRSINIRMLFLVVEKALAKYSETLVFELIDEDTMTLARMNINSYLKNVQSRGGIQAFNVILDDSNNTPETIDSQELHVTIRIDATRTINNILLNFVATRSGAAFTVNG